MPEHGHYILGLRSGHRPLADIPPPAGVDTTSLYVLYELEPARALLRELGADPAFLDDIPPEELPSPPASVSGRLGECASTPTDTPPEAPRGAARVSAADRQDPGGLWRLFGGVASAQPSP